MNWRSMGKPVVVMAQAPMGAAVDSSVNGLQAYGVTLKAFDCGHQVVPERGWAGPADCGCRRGMGEARCCQV